MKSHLFILKIFSFYHIRFFLNSILVLFFFVTGCASFEYPRPAPDCLQGGFKPLPFPMERLRFETFTITPPQGENWCIMHLDRKVGADSIEMGVLLKNQYGGQIMQKPPNRSEANQTLRVAFGVGSLDDMFQRYSKALGKVVNKVSSIDELVMYTRKYHENDLSNSTVKKVRNLEIIPYLPGRESLCVMIKYVAEGMFSQKEPNDIYVYDSNTIQCIHPARPLMFTIHYSERYPAQYPPPYSLIKKYWNEIEPFFIGFDFVP